MRSRFVIGLALFAGAAPIQGEAQQRIAAPTTTVLIAAANPRSPTAESFRRGLQELGYIDGKNISFERLATEQPTEVAAVLNRQKIDLIFATGPAAVSAAARATRTIPIVALDLESDPVREGWVGAFGRPGGNVTGAFLDQPALTGKWLELLREILPRASHVAVLRHPDAGPAQRQAIENEARKLAIQVHLFEATGPDYDPIFAELTKAQPQALVLLSSPRMNMNGGRLAQAAANARIPTIAMFKAFVEDGGLMSYGPDPVEIGRRCAIQADKILKGQRVGDIPVEAPTRIELVMNIKTAAALGVSIPPFLLSRADQIID